MEKFIRFLIWIKYIPVIENKAEGGFNPHYSSMKFFLLMVTLFTSDAFYLLYVVNQLLKETDQPSLSDWSVLVFKITCLLTCTFFPVVFGLAASAQGTCTCQARMSLPLHTLAHVIIAVFMLNVGLSGIHVKTKVEDVVTLLPLSFKIIINFLAQTTSSLVTFAWLYDYLAHCPDGRKKKLITADETDGALELFEHLKSGTKSLLLASFSYVQLLLIFSLYNMMQGKSAF